jgi:hypothetical protein
MTTPIRAYGRREINHCPFTITHPIAVSHFMTIRMTPLSLFSLFFLPSMRGILVQLIRATSKK